MRYLKDMNIKSLSRPGSCNHWPTGQVLCDGRTSQAPDRATSFLGFPISRPPIHEGPEGRNWISSIYGMTLKTIEELAVTARSWAQAPELKVEGNEYKYEEYDLSQRVYILNCKKPESSTPLKFEIDASEKSPLANAAIVIKNWGRSGVRLNINGTQGARGENFSFGHRNNLEGSDLIVWIKKESTKSVNIVLTPVKR